MGKSLIKIAERAVFVVIFLLFGMLVVKYYNLGHAVKKKIGLEQPKVTTKVDTTTAEYKIQLKDPTCSGDMVEIRVKGGVLCRENAEASSWLNIYDTYPKSVGGKEIVYDFLAQGSKEDADKIVNNVYPVERYKDATFPEKLTWTEDPYNDRYWRFIFYSLRPTRNLLYAGMNTNNPVYYQKLESIVNSFIDEGMSKPNAWSDYHGVAFRTMVLTNTWWKLRERNLLSADESTRILKALKVHGDFLADTNHYEPSHNHGVNEATALLLLGINFPDLPNSNEWVRLGKERLDISLVNLVDEDGVLIENSPYYQFYTLEAYWNIYNYSKRYNVTISDHFEATVGKMINYSTYVLQPDLEVPLLGASLERKINLSPAYKQMGEVDPEFLYILSQGKQGKEPKEKSINFPYAGQTVLRSGWGQAEDFKNQTYVLFDYGPYRTKHSDYDALAFSLYSRGKSLIPDPGLYTYVEGEYKNYFQSTAAHNTVTVDNKDQIKGIGYGGTFYQGEDYAYQTAQHNLYKDVTHQRAISLIGQDYVLIVDNMKSISSHQYDQHFNINPGAKVTVDGTTVTASNEDPNQTVTIRQYEIDGMTVGTAIGQKNPIKGFCSEKYNELIPCYSVTYTKKAEDTRFVTLLELGEHVRAPKVSYNKDNDIFTIKVGSKDYNINVSLSVDEKKKIDIKNTPLNPINGTVIEAFQNADDWTVRNPQLKADGVVYADRNDYVSGRQSLVVSSYTQGVNTTPSVVAEKALRQNLTGKNLLLKMKAENIQNSSEVEMSLSSNNWKGYATINLRDSFRPEYQGDWDTISLGRGSARAASDGGWRIYGDGFDWSNIDRIRFKVSSYAGEKVVLHVNELATIPDQQQGNVVIVFDDGYDSIIPAADVMKKYNIRGNVAVIGSNSLGTEVGYLSLQELQKLQNEYGWNMANHSWSHKNALEWYAPKNNYSDLEDDIVKGAEYLIENKINTAPNWYIYPNGANNTKIKEIVAKYYKFARTTQQQVEVYPFGDPLRVKNYLVQNNTPTNAVQKAIDDAKNYKQTLFLTFHRIHSTSSDKSGFEISSFEEIMKYLSAQQMPVKTLSELDVDNGVPLNELTISHNPQQLLLSVKVVDHSLPAVVKQYYDKVLDMKRLNVIVMILSGIMVVLFIRVLHLRRRVTANELTNRTVREKR